MVQLDDDLDAYICGEDPGDLAESIGRFPHQCFDATRRATVHDVVVRLETTDGAVIEDVDLDDVEIETGETDGTFVVRARHHPNRVLAAGAIVTGAALLAAGWHIRYRTRGS
jgi:hypothetical protein